MTAIDDRELQFLAARRVAHLATADGDGHPHVVPVCYTPTATTVYITIDGKPKRASRRELKRLRNLRENPAVALVADRYDEDWTRLGWVMVRGAADILQPGKPGEPGEPGTGPESEHQRAQALLRARYLQLRKMQIEALPVIAIRVDRVSSWGDLGAV